MWILVRTIHFCLKMHSFFFGLPSTQTAFLSTETKPFGNVSKVNTFESGVPNVFTLQHEQVYKKLPYSVDVSYVLQLNTHYVHTSVCISQRKFIFYSNLLFCGGIARQFSFTFQMYLYFHIFTSIKHTIGQGYPITCKRSL